jgi:hypothetical protein
MPVTARHRGGASFLMEVKEFASFPKGTERYIRRSLDVGLRRRDAIAHWARTPDEEASIRAQYLAYRWLDQIRGLIPDDHAIAVSVPLLVPLVAVSAFDLSQARLSSFAAYRFLYERLFGAAVRPWLPSAFCAAAAHPNLHPEDRRILFESLGDVPAAAGWSNREPTFVPDWVDKVDATISV